MTRKSIPERTELNVLLKSARKCCLCAHFNRDFSVKKGQVAHIDRDNSNNAEENLAFLCLPCHDEYDSLPSQSKRIQPGELIEAKRLVEAHCSSLKGLRTSVEISVRVQPSVFSNLELSLQHVLTSGAKKIEMTIEHSGPETYVFTLEADPEDVGSIIAQFDRDDVLIDSFDATAVFVKSENAIGVDKAFGEWYLEEYFPKERASEVVANPEIEKHWSASGSDCNSNDAIISFYGRKFGFERRRYWAVVPVLRSEEGKQEMLPGLLLFEREFPEETIEGLLRSFATKMCFTICGKAFKIILPTDPEILATLSQKKVLQSLAGGIRKPFHYLALAHYGRIATTVYFFCIVDIVKYAGYLKGHGIKTPATIKKKLRKKDPYYCGELD